MTGRVRHITCPLLLAPHINKLSNFQRGPGSAALLSNVENVYYYFYDPQLNHNYLVVGDQGVHWQTEYPTWPKGGTDSRERTPDPQGKAMADICRMVQAIWPVTSSRSIVINRADSTYPLACRYRYCAHRCHGHTDIDPGILAGS